MKVMNGLVMTFEEDEIFVFMWAILPIREWGCQDKDQALLHEIIFFLSQYIQQQWSVRQNYFHSG